jgi:hypothetical protein
MTVYLWAESGVVEPGGTDESELLIVPEEILEKWLPMGEVLNCSTWGQVKALGHDIYQAVLSISGYGEFADFIANFAITGQAPGMVPGPEAIAEWMAKRDEEFPSDDQSFEAYNDIPMVADGDWLPHINLLMADNLPAEILNEFAEWTYTSFNGHFASIPLKHKDAILVKLEQLGHTHREDSRVFGLVVDA